MKISFPQTQDNLTGYSAYLFRVVLKASLLFLAVTLLFAVVQPIPWLEKLSAYNLIFPGRERLPFGEIPDKAYNLSLYQLDAMAKSHAAALPKAADEFRIIMVGDSSIWGFLLPPDQTVSAQLNRLELSVPDGRQVQVFNLGYPTISLTKDLLMLTRVQAYEPDLLIWFVTLEAFPKVKQLESPIVQNNPAIVRSLITTYGLDLDPQDQRLAEMSFWQNTLIGKRRVLADLLRLQLYGVMWSATGIDQYVPDTYEPPQHDLQADLTFQGYQPPALNPDDLSLDVLEAGVQMMFPTPVMIVNEPIYLSNGENSNIRYNFFYPRWAYDDYRAILYAFCEARGWSCLDTWNLIPPENFTNSAIHYNSHGSELLASKLAPAIQAILNR
jgi:hypothetical protein